MHEDGTNDDDSEPKDLCFDCTASMLSDLTMKRALFINQAKKSTRTNPTRTNPEVDLLFSGGDMKHSIVMDRSYPDFFALSYTSRPDDSNHLLFGSDSQELCNKVETILEVKKMELNSIDIFEFKNDDGATSKKKKKKNVKSARCKLRSFSDIAMMHSILNHVDVVNNHMWVDILSLVTADYKLDRINGMYRKAKKTIAVLSVSDAMILQPLLQACETYNSLNRSCQSSVEKLIDLVDNAYLELGKESNTFSYWRRCWTVAEMTVSNEIVYYCHDRNKGFTDLLGDPTVLAICFKTISDQLDSEVMTLSLTEAERIRLTGIIQIFCPAKVLSNHYLSDSWTSDINNHVEDALRAMQRADFTASSPHYVIEAVSCALALPMPMSKNDEGVIMNYNNYVQIFRDILWKKNITFTLSGETGELPFRDKGACWTMARIPEYYTKSEKVKDKVYKSRIIRNLFMFKKTRENAFKTKACFANNPTTLDSPLLLPGGGLDSIMTCVNIQDEKKPFSEDWVLIGYVAMLVDKSGTHVVDVCKIDKFSIYATGKSISVNRNRRTLAGTT